MKKHQLVVCGGGFAGTAAAISAARAGVDTLLLEEGNCLGGLAVNNLVNPFMRYFTQKDGKQLFLSQGLFLEICKRMQELATQFGTVEEHPGTPTMTFNEEYLKIVLQRMALEAGVSILYRTKLIGVKTQNDLVKAVTVAGIGDVFDIEADGFIDATGDAFLCEMAGEAYRHGRESDGLCQPMTLCFRIADVDTKAFWAGRDEMQKKYRELQSKGEIRNIREDVLFFWLESKQMVHFNTTRIVKLDPVNTFGVSNAEIQAREQVAEMFAFLRKYAAGCEKAVLVSSGAKIGNRESRMVVGEYTLTQDDLLECRKFPDGIAACDYDIDIHNPDGSGTSHYFFKQGTYYTIPYRCLVPQKNKNLLVAGKCISSTHEAQASYRIMPVVATLGEAAGTAAAIALQKGCSMKDVPVPELLNTLKENGAFLGE